MITINGVSYQEIERQKPSRSSSKLLMMAAAFGGMGMDIKTRHRPTISLEEEFELIQNKQSKLSRSDREWVIWTFNNKYKQI